MSSIIDIKKHCFIIFLVLLYASILWKEVASFCSPINAFRIIYDSDFSIMQFSLWIFWIYILTPALFLLLLVLWNVKYHIIEPKLINKLYLYFLDSYIEGFLVSIVAEFYAFASIYCTNNLLYTLVHFSKLFPSLYTSNIFFIELSIVTTAYVSLVLSSEFLFTASIIVSRFSYQENMKKFFTRNWGFLCSFLSILLFYVSIMAFTLHRIQGLTSIASFDINNYMGMSFINSLVFFNILKNIAKF